MLLIQVPANVPLLKDAVVLRDEAARLLGYPNHAAFVLEDRMAHDVATVNSFLSDLRSKLKQKGAAEASHLGELKKADVNAKNDSSDSNVFYWDKAYYERILIQNEYNVDQRKVSEYFPLQHTVAAMLQVYEELFGMVFVELKGAERDALSPTGKGGDIVWHEDVIMFSVWDAEGSSAANATDDGFMGYLYFDLHPRQGKYGVSPLADCMC
jgi:metallopeptidase MepB